MEQCRTPIPSELSRGRSVFKVVRLSPKRMRIGELPYFRSAEVDIIFVGETKSFQE